MTRLIALTALIAACLVAGCGGSNAQGNAYVNAVNKAQKDFATSVGQPSSTTDTLTQLETALGKIVTDLKAADPPDDVKALHTTLVTQFGDFKDSVGAVSAAVATKDQQKIAAAQTKFTRDSAATQAKIAATITAINEKLHE